VLNASRRFRYTLDLKKEEEKRRILSKIRAHAQVIWVNNALDLINNDNFFFLYNVLINFIFWYCIRLHIFSRKLGIIE
jgi:hypothetical protein